MAQVRLMTLVCRAPCGIPAADLPVMASAHLMTVVQERSLMSYPRRRPKVQPPTLSEVFSVLPADDPGALDPCPGELLCVIPAADRGYSCRPCPMSPDVFCVIPKEERAADHRRPRTTADVQPRKSRRPPQTYSRGSILEWEFYAS